MAKLNYNEQGRSMVEMLGVLTIIGVLSVGAIGGYSYAMNKHRTNELIYEATKQAQWAGTQMEMHNTNPTLAGFGSRELGGGTIAGVLPNLANNQIGIIVSNLKEGVCDGIKNSIGEHTVIRAIKNADATGDVTCEDDMTAALIFNQDLSTTDSTGTDETENETDDEEEDETEEAQSCDQTSDCPYCHTCTGSKCVADMLCDNHCPPEKPVLTKYGTCIACPSAEKGEILDFEAMSRSECIKCGYLGYHEGICQQNICPEGYWMTQYGSCVPCDYPVGIFGFQGSCAAACPNRIEINGKCALPSITCGENQFKYRHGEFCYNCSYEEQGNSVASDSECTENCNNRDIIPGTDICAPIDCPNGYGSNSRRCCTVDEIYIRVGATKYGRGEYGYCCPETRPNYSNGKCNP